MKCAQVFQCNFFTGVYLVSVIDFCNHWYFADLSYAQKGTRNKCEWPIFINHKFCSHQWVYDSSDLSSPGFPVLAYQGQVAANRLCIIHLNLNLKRKDNSLVFACWVGTSAKAQGQVYSLGV